ncbi:MAG: hypothetical protein R3F49_03075 [Planctomycetota bacterium]
MRLRRLPKTNALLSERAGLASAPRPSVLRAAAPLVLFGAAAAAVLYNRGLEDQRGMLVGGGLAAIGIAAAYFETRRVARLGRRPIEAHLVRFGVRDTGVHEPGARQGEHASGGHGKVRWLIALEDGSVRHVWPQPDARGRAAIQPGAAGVAWTQGEYVLGFEPIA